MNAGAAAAIRRKSRMRINLRFSGIVLATFALLAVAAFFLHRVQFDRTVRFIKNNADRAEERGDIAAASEQLSMYLGYHPHDAEALARKGWLAEQVARTPADHAQALEILEQAARLAPNNDALRRKLIPIAIKLKRFLDVTDHLNLLAKDGADDAQSELWRAQCERARGQPDVALKRLENAIRLDRQLIDAYAEMASLLRTELKKPTQADGVIDRMVVANPANAIAYLRRGQYRQLFNIEGTESDLQKARELAPNDVQVLLAFGSWESNVGRYDLARGALEHGRSQHPKEAGFPFLLARVEMAQRRPAAAVDILRSALAAVDDKATLENALADHLISAGELDEALTLIERRRHSETTPGAFLDYLEARIESRRENWSQALEMLNRARAGLPALESNPASDHLATEIGILLGRAYEKLNNSAMQLSSYRAVLEKNPGSVVARLGEARTLEALGQTPEALASYQRIAQRDPSAALGMVRLATRVELEKNENARDWGRVDTLLALAAKTGADEQQLALARAGVLVARGDSDASKAALEAARRAEPNRDEPWLVMINLEERAKGPEAALVIVDQAQEKLGDRLSLRITRARLIARIPATAAIMRSKLTSLRQGLDRFERAQTYSFLNDLASIYASLGLVSDATQLWQDVARGDPSNLRARLLLFDVALRSGEPRKIDAALADIKRVEGEDGTLWRFGEASWIVARALRGEKANLNEARAHLTELEQRRPEWSRVPILKARLAEAENRPDEALTLYRRALDLGEDRLQLLERIAAIHLQQENFDAAEAVLGELPGHVAPTPALSRIAVRLALHKGNRDEAAKLAKQAVPQDGATYSDLIWLAYILDQAGEGAQAEAALRRAAALSPQSTEAWVMLVRQLKVLGKDDRAIDEVIREAESLLNTGNRDQTLAICFELAGRPREAELRFKAAVEANRENPRAYRGLVTHLLHVGNIADAQSTLRVMLAPRTNLNEMDRAWARRTLAIQLLSDGSPTHYAEAQALLAKNLESTPSGARDRVLQAFLLAMQPGRRGEAIHEIERLALTEPLESEEKVLLARLQLAQRDWPAARSLLMAVLKEDEANLNHASLFASAAISHHQPELATPWIKRLVEREPDSLRTAEIKANWLIAQGQVDAANTLLRDHAQKHPDRIGPIAAMLERHKQLDASTDQFRKLAEQGRPESRLALAAHLARKGQVFDALEMCEKAWTSCPPDAVAAAIVSVLAAPAAQPAQIEQGATAIARTLEKDPSNIGLLLQLATLRHRQGREDDAEQLYRRVLALDPKHIVGLNNLAWSLALRRQNLDEALRLISRAVEILGPTPALLDTRAMTYLALGRTQDAIADLKALQAHSPNAVSHFRLAVAHLEAQDRSAARAYWHQAQDVGLTINELDPLERPTYRQVAAKLAQQ